MLPISSPAVVPWRAARPEQVGTDHRRLSPQDSTASSSVSDDVLKSWLPSSRFAQSGQSGMSPNESDHHSHRSEPSGALQVAQRSARGWDSTLAGLRASSETIAGCTAKASRNSMAHRFLESPQEQRIAANIAVSRVSTDLESVDLAARALSRRRRGEPGQGGALAPVRLARQPTGQAGACAAAGGSTFASITPGSRAYPLRALWATRRLVVVAPGVHHAPWCHQFHVCIPSADVHGVVGDADAEAARDAVLCLAAFD